MSVRVCVVGYDLIGKRIADAVACQQDMELVHVVEDDPQRHPFIAARGFPLSRHFPDPCVGTRTIDIAVLCRNDGCLPEIPVVLASHLRREEGMLFSPTTAPERVLGQMCVRIPSPDVIAVGRLVKAISGLAGIERLFANTITRVGHATAVCSGSADAFEPLADDDIMNRQWSDSLAGWVLCHEMRRIRVPYTHSHLHVIKLDVDRLVEHSAVLDAIVHAPRLLLVSAADGFETTADLQEFFRDGSRLRFDRPEVVVWKESVTLRGRQLYLMMDVCQEATSIPETVDAIRLRQSASADGDDSVRQTDTALGIGDLWRVPARNQETGRGQG